MTAQLPDEGRWLSAKQIAAVTGMAVSTARRRMRDMDGVFVIGPTGKELRVTAGSFAAWKAAQETRRI